MIRSWKPWSLLLSITLYLSATATHSQDPMRKEFPNGFKWCVATSAHQVEGGNTESDWWHWEQQAGRIAHGDVSGAAADHWNRLAEDIGLLQDLGVGMYRFSVEWAKLEPREGEWDLQVLNHYRRKVRSLRAVGIEPMVTLIHFTLPQWLAERGGVEWERFPEAFAAYTQRVKEALDREVRYWITFNEPMVWLSAGYHMGIFPPGENRAIAGLKVPITQVLKAHALAYPILKLQITEDALPDQVGFAFHMRSFQAYQGWNPVDQIAAAVADRHWNYALASAVQDGVVRFSIPGVFNWRQQIAGLAGTQDFLGVNYYSRDLIHVSLSKGLERMTGSGPLTDLNWEIYPEGIYQVLKETHKRFPSQPIFITENGLADHRDHYRANFIRDHLEQIHKAISEGVPVQGYCHWSLLDNFEWAEGFEPRFGLFEVDYLSGVRTPRPSRDVYRDIINKNALD